MCAANLLAVGAASNPSPSCGPARCAGAAVRVAALDARDEMVRAAHWGRARLEANGRARIAIVVPDIAARKGALRRALAQTMDPGRTATVLPFNISLGDPLSGYPLVAHALAALALGGREIAFERASGLIRSPFIAGGESELQQRARLGRMAAETLFQPETPEVPVQVLGLIEAAGMTFDHLWVMGLSDEAWPTPVHLNPFIPVHLPVSYTHLTLPTILLV